MAAVEELMVEKTCGDDIKSLKVDRTQRGGREDGSDGDDREEQRELADTNFFKEDALKQKEKQSRVSTKENAVGKKMISVRHGSSKKKINTRKKKSEKKGSVVKVRSSKSKKSLASKRKEAKDVKRGMELYKGIYEAKLAVQKTQLQENIKPNSKKKNFIPKKRAFGKMDLGERREFRPTNWWNLLQKRSELSKRHMIG